MTKRTILSQLTLPKSQLLRVALCEVGGASTAVGVVSRWDRMAQSAHCPVGPYAFEKLAFTHSALVKDQVAFAKHLTALLPVGSPSAKFHRQGMLLRTAALVPCIDRHVLSLLREVVWQAPRSLPPSILGMLKYDKEEMQKRQPEQYLVELAIKAAFRGRLFSLALGEQELGLEKYERFVSELQQPERNLLLAVGPDAPALSDLAPQELSSPTFDHPDQKPNMALEQVVADDAPSFSGTENVDLVEENEQEELAHFGVFTQAVSASDPLYAAQHVLLSLLGGGGAFSAGGPGKGMFSRLYATVLNRQHFVESIRAHVQDNLFGLTASCQREYAPRLASLLGEQLTRLAAHVTDDELCRARQQASSAVLMAGEQRLQLFDQLATLSGPEPWHLAALIQTVTGSDLEALHARLFPASTDGVRDWVYVAYGKLPSTLPRLHP